MTSCLVGFVFALASMAAADDFYLAPNPAHPGKYAAPTKPNHRLSELKAACRLSMNGYVGIAHLWDVPKD